MPASSIGSYAQFLALLLSLGPKLQTLWPKIQAVIASVTDLINTLKSLAPAAEQPTPGTLSQFSVMSDEAEAETKIAMQLAGPTGAFDGTIFRGIWQFTQAHPELLTLLVSLLKGG